MSSSETMPRGHSNQARMLVVPITRPVVGPAGTRRSEAFYAAEDAGREGVYALAMAAFIQVLAQHFDLVTVGSQRHARRVRQLAPMFEGAHGRTGNAAAEIAYGWEVFLAFSVHLEAITATQARATWERVQKALRDIATEQGEHLHAEDPVNRAVSLLNGLLSQGRVFLEDIEGGHPEPEFAESCGWRREVRRLASGEEVEEFSMRPGAVMVGWYSRQGGDEWGHFLPDALHEALQRAAQGQSGALLPDPGTLWANMRDRLHPAGLMRCEVQSEAGRVVKVRFLPKVTVRGERRRLLTFRLPFTLPAYESGGAGGAQWGSDEDKASDTVLKPAPLNLFFSKESGAEWGSLLVNSSPAVTTPASLAALGSVKDGEPWKVEL